MFNFRHKDPHKYFYLKYKKIKNMMNHLFFYKKG